MSNTSTDRPRYPPANKMNPALHQRFEGLDMDGKAVAGVIERVGNYDRKTGKPSTFVLLLDNPPIPAQVRANGSTEAIIKAADVAAHLEGMAFCNATRREDE